MAPITPPHQIIAEYGMNPSPSYSPDPPSIASNHHHHSDSSKTAFSIPNDSPDYHHHPRNNSLASDAQSPRSNASSFSTKMTTTNPGPPPFEVPKTWQTAMSMVSINAGLYPQQVLQHFYKLYPFQVAAHPQYTELDIWRSQRAKDRGIKAIRVHHADADPTRIYLMFIFLDELDPLTKQPIVRLITNTSIRHVLEEPCSNCPLWLPVRVSTNDINLNNLVAEGAPGGSHHPLVPSSLTLTASTTTTPYTLIPCCEAWVQSADFDAPLSNEEKKVPEMINLLLAEMRRKNALLVAKDEEIARLLAKKQENRHHHRPHHHHHVEENIRNAAVAAAGLAAHQVHAAFDAEAWIQYWWAGAALIILIVMLLFR